MTFVFLAGLWSLISRNSSTAESVDAVSDFASQSLLLLLVLTNHCSTEKNWSNPYRQALLSFTDSQGIRLNNLR